MPRYKVNETTVYAYPNSNYNDVSLYTPSGEWHTFEELSSNRVYLFDIDDDGNREVVDIYDAPDPSRNMIKISARNDNIGLGDEVEFIAESEVDEIERASYISSESSN